MRIEIVVRVYTGPFSSGYLSHKEYAVESEPCALEVSAGPLGEMATSLIDLAIEEAIAKQEAEAAEAAKAETK